MQESPPPGLKARDTEQGGEDGEERGEDGEERSFNLRELKWRN